MTVLVLGSDGLIGKELTKYLKTLNHNVIEFDNFSNPINDLRIPNILDSILPTVNFVFFLAFDVGGSVYLKNNQNSYSFISNNIKIMNNTFDSLKKIEVPFIFASSQMSNMSYSSYGILKHIGEKYTNCLNGKIIKFWNIYGPERDLTKLRVISDFVLMAKNNNYINIKTNGSEKRQFLYVNDCNRCLNMLMNEFHYIEEKKLDVSSFNWIKIVDLANIISSKFNNCPVNIGEDIDDVQRDSLKEPDKTILKYWKPEISLNDGIDKIINHEKINLRTI